MSNTYNVSLSMLYKHNISRYNINMELRELKYFLEIARQKSISRAAETLYITQPSLSRQMQNLEKEIGKPLFIRGSKQITLTEAGVLLKKRAEEFMALYEKTSAELTYSENGLSGEIHIGCGESHALGTVAEAAESLVREFPNIRFSFFSADTEDVMEKLDKGLIDFGVLVLPANLDKFEHMTLPDKDVWGVLMRKDSPLTEKEVVTPEDLYDKPLIRSRHAMSNSFIDDWFLTDRARLNIVATYNLIYNASLLVKAGMGYAIGLDKIVNTSGDSELTFRSLSPPIETSLAFAWKRNQIFSDVAKKFMEVLTKKIADKNFSICK